MAAYSTPPQSFFTVYQVFSILISNPWIDNTRKFLHEKRQFQHTGLYVRMDESINGKDRTGPDPRLFLSSGPGLSGRFIEHQPSAEQTVLTFPDYFLNLTVKGNSAPGKCFPKAMNRS